MVDPVITDESYIPSADERDTRFQQQKEEDIARQKGEAEIPDARTVFEDILSSTTVDEINSKGYTSIGDVRITPESIAAYNQDANKKANLFRTFMQEYKVPEAIEGGPVVAFSGPKYEGLRLPDEFAGDENYIDFVENQQDVAKLLMKSGLPARGQQIFVDDWANTHYGRGMSELGTALLDIPTDAFQGMPSLGSMALAAAEGFARGANDYLFGNYPENFGESFSRRYGDAMQRYYGGMGGFNLANLESTTEGWGWFANARQRMETWYKDTYIEKYGRDAWINDHAFPEKINVVFDEQGNPSLEIARDENGEIIYDEKLDPAIANSLIDASWNELSDAQQAGIFFFGGGPFVMANVARKVNKGFKYAQRVDNARKENPGRFQDMTDVEVLEYLRETDTNVLFSKWRKAWKKVPLVGGGKFGGYKDELASGQVIASHRESLKFYDDKISETENRIEALSSRVGPLTADEAAELRNLPNELDFFKKGRARYSNQSGLNPYVRGAFFDEAYIAGAMAYAPTYIPTDALGMSDGTAEMLSALAAPFLAPYAGRKIKEKGVGIASRLPVVGMGVRGIEDLGSHLASSEIVGKIGMGAIVRGDIDEIRSIADAEGIALTDDDIKALRAFNTAMNRMGTEVFEIGGEKVTMRDQMFNSLVEYGNNMGRMRNRLSNMKDVDGNLVFTEDEVNQNMQSLHLSFAYASGFAPFIRIQQLAADGKSVTEIFEGGKADSLFRALRQQDDVLRGMTAQLTILRTAFAAEGVRLDSNDPINEVIFKLERGVEAGQDNLTRRREEMNQLINLYLRDPSSVDEGFVDEIVDMRLMLMPDDVAKTVNRAKLAEDTADALMSAFVERQRELVNIAERVPPFKYNEYIKRGADILFDISLGVRKARGSARYTKVNDYAAEKNIIINMDSVARKLADVSDDVTEVGGIAYAFGGGREFLRKGGRDLEKTFEKMARRGLEREFGGDVDALIESLYKVDEKTGKRAIPKPTATEAALFLAEKDASDLEPLAFFLGNVEEVEDIRRVFAYNSYQLASKDGPAAKGAKQYLNDFKMSIDELFAEADPEGGLSDLLETARKGWQKDVGDVTEGGTYGGNVLTSRQRKLETRPKGQRKYVYRNTNMAPEQAFERLGDLFARVATAKNKSDVSRFGEEIENIKTQIFFYYGINLDEAGRPIFDMSIPAERRLAEGLSLMFSSVVNNRVGNAIAPRVTPQNVKGTTSLLPSEIQPQVRRATEGMMTVGKELPPFNFERANWLLDAEQRMAIRVKNPDGTIETRLPFSTELKNEIAHIDDLLADNVQYRQVYEDIRNEVNTVGSDLRNAGNATLQKQQDAVNKLDRIIGDVRNPERFFDLHLSNLNQEGYDALKSVLKSGGMSDDEAVVALKEMYLRGTLAKSGLKTKTLAGFGGKAVEDITDVSVLVEMVNNPAQRSTMDIVLGKEHAEHLADIADWMNNASGNGAGVKAYFDVGQMRMESKIARVFNLARGMVGLDYVIAEVGFRVMMQERQSQIMFILQNKNAARILSKVLNTPRSVTRKDLELLGFEVRSHLMLELLKTGGEIETLDQLLGDDIPIGLESLGEAAREEELKTLIDIVEGESDEKND